MYGIKTHFGKVFAIEVDGRCINVIVDRLKPAYLIIQDSETTSSTTSPSSTIVTFQYNVNQRLVQQPSERLLDLRINSRDISLSD